MTAPDPSLRDRIAAAIRAAACPGGCDSTEEECRTQRIQPLVWHRGVLAEVEGTPEQFADAVLPLLADAREAGRRDGLREAADAAHAEGNRLYDDSGQRHAAGAWAVRDALRARADAEDGAR